MNGKDGMDVREEDVQHERSKGRKNEFRLNKFKPREWLMLRILPLIPLIIRFCGNVHVYLSTVVIMI